MSSGIVSVELLPAVILLGLAFQFADSTVGMGFGTLTPALILLGHDPLHVVSAVLLTSAVLSLFVGGLYQLFENMDVTQPSTRRTTLTLTAFGIAGVLGGSMVALTIPERLLQLYIGGVITVMGVLVIALHSDRPSLSLPKLAAIGGVAAFNKGITGGGFGPVMAGGQMISGIQGKEAVGVTALVEGIVSAVGVAGFLMLGEGFHLDWSLVGSLLVGGVIASPVASYTVSGLDPRIMRILVSAASILTGIAIIVQVL